MAGSRAKVPFGTVVGYGMGQMGAQIFRDTPAVLLPIFMTTMLGVPAWMAGLAILIPKLWVIICDPLVGVWSDRLKPMRGRTPFLFYGAILTSIGFVSLFAITDYGSPWLAAGAICVIFLLASTGFSLYSVPYLAIASELSSDRHERTRILAFRMAATIGGVILGVGVAQPLVFALGGGAQGWQTMAVVFAVICLVSMLIPAFALRKTKMLESDAVPAGLFQQMRPVLDNKPYLTLLATAFIQGIGQASGYTVIGFYYLYALGEVSLIPKFIIVMSVGSMISQPTFFYLSKWFGKERVYWVSSILWTLITITWFFVHSGSPVLFELPLLGAVTEQGGLVLVRGFFLGIVNTGFLLLSFSMLTDTIEYQRRKTGVANEGVFSGLWSAAEKLAFALGPLIAGFVMSLYGFESSNHGAIAQSEDAVVGIKLLYSFIPVTTQVLSLIVFSRYRLDSSEIGDLADPDAGMEAIEASEAGLKT